MDGRSPQEERELTTHIEATDDNSVLTTSTTPVLVNTNHCKTKEDTGQAGIFDIISLEVDGCEVVIVTDCNNECIKAFYQRNDQQQYSRLSVPNIPLRIAKVDNNKIAVTVPGCDQIILASVNPDLSLDSAIKTQKSYSGLTVLTSTTLAAGSWSPPCVDIIDMNASVIRSFNPLHNGKMLIEQPNFMCTTRHGNILISDYATRSVVCVTPDEELVFNFCPTNEYKLLFPAGIVSTMAGHIIVVDSNGNKLVQLNESGEFVRYLLTVLDGISPHCVHYDESGRLLVTQSCHSFKVFTFRKQTEEDREKALRYRPPK